MSWLDKAWQRQASWLWLIWPLSLVFRLSASLRKKKLQAQAKIVDSQVPVIVVGNISVGGTGKTPFVIALANHLKAEGLRPGIISRGYKSNANHYPFFVDVSAAVTEVGDEALLLVEKTQCPMVIDADRRRAAEHLLQVADCDVIVSDDGMQHYRLHRDMEIAIVDGQRLFGNGLTLPAGPLREPVSRLRSVDHIIVNGEPSAPHGELTNAIIMELIPKFLVNMVSGEKKSFNVAPFNIGNRVQAVTGIGNPQRFYELLEKLPYQVEKYSFPDHHAFTAEDFEKLAMDSHQPVVMTEKDAVKCRTFARNNFWYLVVDVKLPDNFLEQLSHEIKTLVQKTTDLAFT